MKVDERRPLEVREFGAKEVEDGLGDGLPLSSTLESRTAGSMALGDVRR